jgi:hypothetical protein
VARDAAGAIESHRAAETRRLQIQTQTQKPHPHHVREITGHVDRDRVRLRTHSRARPPAHHTRLLLAAGCVALADRLFYGWDVGVSLALFLGVLGVVAVASNGVHTTRKTKIVMTVVFIAGLLAAIEDVNLLSVILSTLATALFVNVITAPARPSWQRAPVRSRDGAASRSISIGRRSVRRAPPHESMDAGVARLAGCLDRSAQHLLAMGHARLWRRDHSGDGA